METIKFLLLKKNGRLKGVLVNSEDNEKRKEILIKKLKSSGIQFESLSDSGVYMTCEWSTFVALISLQVPFHLTISGGGVGYFDKVNVSRLTLRMTTSNYSLYHGRNYQKKSVGIIDTGSSPPTLCPKNDVEINDTMANFSAFAATELFNVASIRNVLKKNADNIGCGCELHKGSLV